VQVTAQRQWHLARKNYESYYRVLTRLATSASNLRKWSTFHMTAFQYSSALLEIKASRSSMFSRKALPRMRSLDACPEDA